MLPKEYVDQPELIDFTPDRRVRVKSTWLAAVPLTLPSAVVVDKYYAIRADTADFPDSFCVAKAIQCYPDKFRAVYLDRDVISDTSNTLGFVETKNVGIFYLGTIVNELVSATNTNSSHVRVSLEEIEEIIVSANTDTWD